MSESECVIVNLGFVWNQRSEEALALIEHMAVKPDPFIYTIAFSVCADLNNERSKKLGRQMFEKMSDSDRRGTAAMTAALHMFATFGDLRKAKEVFDLIKNKDSISYGAMIKAYYSNDDPLKALKLFSQMKKDGIAINAIEHVLAVKTCSEIGMLDHSRSIAAQIPKHFLNDHVLQNALIDMWVSRFRIQ